ncbi:hypothetical protein KP509_36G036100 [Ceratopteris richardii]|nr:hypothetical protein KP509_36G036100 [Ceratopteris richardii]
MCMLQVRTLHGVFLRVTRCMNYAMEFHPP